jgi:hypothetical protein
MSPSQDLQANEPPQPRQTPKAARDRWIKIGFAAVTVFAAMAIWRLRQVNPTVLPGWEQDLAAARKTAREANRPILLVFVSQPRPGDDSDLTLKSLDKSAKRIAEGGFVRAKAPIPADLNASPARDFGVKKIPAVLILGADGNEIRRREGRIGESDMASFIAGP